MGASDYLIGGANVWFNDGNGYLNLGNIPNFNITREVNELTHFTASTGERKLDKSIINEAKLGLNFNIDEFDGDNVNILVYGDGATSTTVASGSVSDEVIVAPLVSGRSVFTSKSNISSLIVGDDGVPTITYTLNDDYFIKNVITGEIQVILGGSGSITAGQDLFLDYDNAERIRDVINPGKDFVKSGQARFEFLASCGNPVTWIIQNCVVKVEGDITLDSENFSSANVIIDILVDDTIDPANPYGVMQVG